MAIRIPWDCYEVALLFSAYEQVADGADYCAAAVRLSETLRALANRRGVAIDETYRNVNGIKMQLANVQYLFTDGKKGLSGASAMIHRMFELYKASPTDYQKILKEAIRLASSNTSIEDAFFSYAKERITAAEITCFPILNWPRRIGSPSVNMDGCGSRIFRRIAQACIPG